jgi:hypothetical protein
MLIELGGDRPKAFGSMLERLGPETGKPMGCPMCGKRSPVKERSRPRTIQSLAGELTFTRNYHYCERCKEGFYPRDHFLGLAEEGDLTPELEGRILDFAVNDTFVQAAERFTYHYKIAISENLVRRVADRAGRACAEADADVLQAVLTAPEDTLVPNRERTELLIVQTDGSHLPVRGVDAWKEAKLGVVVRASAYRPRTGERRGVITRARYAAVLGGQDEFAAALSACLRAERAVHGPVAWVADGAPGNWRLAEELAPHATQILDWYHALEHAMTCGRALLGEAHPALALWKERCETLLATGDVEQTVRELTECVELCTPEQTSAVDALVRYYRANQNRMLYNRYREQAMPIGSGIVESAHQHVLQCRMKKTGQRWSLHHGRRMVRLRAAYRTAGATRFYSAIRAAHRTTRANRKPAPTQRRADRTPRVGENLRSFHQTPRLELLTFKLRRAHRRQQSAARTCRRPGRRPWRAGDRFKTCRAGVM